ncbi:MAG: DUF2207 domain-containing protein [Erysipelotrichaceae bacterium]|nr:DUF2207 domain-containing protein [Erysipelotrichaceae bacterium]
MKHLTRKLFATLVAICLFVPFVQIVHADDDGYYYQSVHVDVEVNDAREYKITETLDVYYNEERHGIIRTIPLSSSVENYKIEDISVQGAPADISTSSYSANIKIGDANETVTGLKRYIVSYTLKHYKDYDEDYDYVYLNLLGNEYDTYVETFSATITLDSSLEVLSQTVTSGSTYSTTNKYVDFTNKGNVFSYSSNQKIPSYNAVTVQMQLPQDSFVNAPQYVFHFTVEENNTEIVVNEEKDYEVSRHLVITNNTDADSSYLFSPEFDDYYDDYDVLDFKASDDSTLSVSYIHTYLKPYETKDVTVTYTLHPKTISRSNNKFTIVTRYDDVETKNASFTITYPEDTFTYEVTAGRYNDEEASANDYIVTQNGSTVSLQLVKTYYQGEVLELYVEPDISMFHRPTPPWFYVSMVISSILALGALLLKLTKFGSKVPETIEFYPPEGLNPLEIGYLIDHTIDNKDITSMILYWASKGCLQIFPAASKNYIFNRLQNPPFECPAYEYDLFEGFFDCGFGSEVSTNDLEDNFYIYADAAKKAVTEKYAEYRKTGKLFGRERNEQSIWKKTGGISFLFTVLGCLPAIFSWAIATYINSGALSFEFFVSVFLGIFMFAGLKAVARGLANPYGSKLASVFLIIFGAIFTFIPFAIGAGLNFQSGNALYIYMGGTILSAVVILMTSNVQKYTEYGERLMSSVLGFRTFIKTAEKERLEALLEDNPEYFYDILPYAQVLHVTSIWEKKFENILIEPPTWYVSEAPFTTRSFVRDMTNMNDVASFKSDPPYSSSDSGGGFSGGGGGFSGGGSSGGGSGGGGSSSW